MDRHLGVGIIGLGVGLRHAQAVQQDPRTRLAGVADQDANIAARRGRELSPDQTATDYRELLANPAIDLIIVATPDHFHRDQTVAALLAGKHVLVEKPMAPSLAECQDMVDAARAAGKLLMVGHSVRFTPAFTTIKTLVDHGDLGEIYYVGSSYEHDYGRLKRPAAWRFDPKYARHQFLGGGCHAVDLLRLFLPDIRKVAAVSNHFSLPESPKDDCILALYRAGNGAAGRVQVTAGCKRPYEIALQVYGTTGTFVADNVSDRMRYWTLRVPGLEDRWMEVPVNVNNHPFDAQLAHLVAAITGEVEPLIPGEEGMRTVALALASIEAAQADTWVEVTG